MEVRPWAAPWGVPNAQNTMVPRKNGSMSARGNGSHVTAEVAEAAAQVHKKLDRETGSASDLFELLQDIDRGYSHQQSGVRVMKQQRKRCSFKPPQIMLFQIARYVYLHPWRRFGVLLREP